MCNRDQAQELLDEFISCMPKTFYRDLDATKRGAYFILAYLARAEGVVVAGDFSKMLHVSTARIAALLRTMEQRELITRHHASEDARRTIVEITPAGIERLGKIKEQALMKVERLLERFSKEELQTFIRLSYKIRQALDE